MFSFLFGATFSFCYLFTFKKNSNGKNPIVVWSVLGNCLVERSNRHVLLGELLETAFCILPETLFDDVVVVAVTRVDREVIVKEEYLLPVKFDDNESVRVIDQDISKITIPRRDDQTSGTNFEVIIGLVVTPQQAIYNRSGASLKFPDL